MKFNFPARLAILAVTALLWSVAAMAARPGSVDLDGAELRDSPMDGSKIIEKLAKGTPITASNLPVRGFFKVRAPDGNIGWLTAESVILQSPGATPAATQEPGVPPLVSSPNVLPPTPAPAPRRSKKTAATFREAPAKKYLRITALSGYGMFSMGSAPAPVSGFFGGFYYGAELNYIFTPDIAMIVRVENIGSTIVATDTATSVSYQLNLSSTPIMVGMEIAVIKAPKYSFGFGVMGGLGIQTQLQLLPLFSTTLGSTTVNQDVMTGLARVDFNWQLTKVLGLMGEVGYRLLETSALSASGSAGSEFFTSGGIAVNMSGPLLDVGVSVSF